jgi:hypothetical protein
MPYEWQKLTAILEDVRAEIALRWQWAKVADIFEEQVVEPLGPFQWETYREKNLIVMQVLHERPLLQKRTAAGLQSGRDFVIPDKQEQATESSDFELITWLVIKSGETDG